uniref:Gamma-secretase subunit PEN-2 n=2 Tax=Equus asinus TaxID=9793 RepID=A0A9L0JJB8_EQUAS
MRMREALPHQKDYKLQRCLRQLAQASVVESGETSRPQEVDCPGAWLFAILASVTWGPGWVSPRGPSGRPCLRANMNLERVSNEEKLNLCRKYYLGGFAFLPFLWLVNIFWFFREAFLVPAYTEQSQIKGCESRAQMKGGRPVWGGESRKLWWERMMEVPEFWVFVEEKKGLVWGRPESRWRPAFPTPVPSYRCLALSCGLPLLGDYTHHLDHHLPDLPAPLGRPWGLPLLHHTLGYPLTTSSAQAREPAHSPRMCSSTLSQLSSP